MNARNVLWAVVLSALPICATSAAYAAEGKAAAPSKKQAAPSLEKGMSAEDVIKLIGRPKEIKPMAVPEGTTGKAEMWIYRRDAGTRTTQVAIGTRDVAGFTGAANPESAQHRTEIIYGPKTITIEQVTTLLMFDDKLVVARQVNEQHERY